MTVDRQKLRRALQEFKFSELFIEILGWDHYDGRLTPVEVNGERFTFTPVAEKRGLPILICSPGEDGQIPDKTVRGKIEQGVRKQVQEHLIIYVDRARTTQLWQWAKREPGQPIRRREQTFQPGLREETLLQRLADLHFPIELEEDLTLTDVTGRMRSTFDRNADRVTTAFFTRFKTEQERFQKFIEGIDEPEHRRWYASVMLNRLMFVYFIQKKGFLDGDRDYLGNRLKRVQAQRGAGQFHSFYRHFLLRLFHDALGKAKENRDPEIGALVGDVRYLNGGLFDIHGLEREYAAIDIPDEAFEKIFAFFDAYHWHLDDRPLRNDDEINPDVLGHIFEKYVNQKQMGAYYTKEDITEYIGKNTIIPFLLDAARKDDRVAFAPDGAVWRFLRDEPDRYVYDAVRKGTDKSLPPAIAPGIDDVSKRAAWNRPADEEYGLPTEIWREHVARRQRYQELFKQLVEGEVTEINDLITHNLDIRQFAVDVIDDAESPDLVRAFWKAITSITVLDPTCGSGAFLFAALNILVPLYEACLDRMAEFVAEADASDLPRAATRYETFRKVLAAIETHPNRHYYVLKSIILNNLYGVDIMEEAVEICKLRLFLKLVSQLEDVKQIEPLPDIDFNIRAGNTLVGFARLSEAQAAIGQKFDFEGVAAKVEEQAKQVGQKARLFREQQEQPNGLITPEHKMALREQLTELEETLNQYLSEEYGYNEGKDAARYQQDYAAWRANHQPFHWFVDFYEIMEERGGFDVIIGNPPWNEYAAVRREYTVLGYQTERTGNLHCLCTERGVSLLSQTGHMSFIVQLPVVSSARMRPVRELLLEQSAHLHVATFDDRPGKLFDGLQHCRSTIFLISKASQSGKTDCNTSRYHRWHSIRRPDLFETLAFSPLRSTPLMPLHLPKYPAPWADSAFSKLAAASKSRLGYWFTTQRTHDFLFYQEATQYWVKATVGLPFYSKNGTEGAPAHGRYAYFEKGELAQVACALANSSLFYAYFIMYGDCFHLSDTLLKNFPCSTRVMEDLRLAALGQALTDDLKANAAATTIRTKAGDVISYAEFSGAKSKPIIDEIDRVLAKHYRFTDKELDFIINYDIKYRMGRDGVAETADEQDAAIPA